MEQLKSRLRQKQKLPVGVFATPAVESVLARTGLTMVDLLRPVSLVNKLNGRSLSASRGLASWPCMDVLTTNSRPRHSSHHADLITTCASAAAVPMRVGEYSMRVQEVQLALYQGSSMFQPAPEVRSCCSTCTKPKAYGKAFVNWC